MRERKRTGRLLLLVLLAGIVAPATAQRVNDAELLLREARHKQQVDGDLQGAIRIYQQIVNSRTATRPVLASALLELAGCYERQGQQSEAIYQRITREFADQPAAAAARARLAAMRPPAAQVMTQTKLTVSGEIQNIVGTDGRRAVYWDRSNTTLYIGDLAGAHRDVVLKTDQSPRALASRDLSQLFLVYPASSQGPLRFVVMRTDGTGSSRELTLKEQGKPLPPPGLFAGQCGSWSWDSRYVTLCYPGDKGTRLLKVPIADGEITDLLPGQAMTGVRAEFSPDGRYVAYNLGYPLGVGVVSADGGEGQVISQDAWLLDWTADGRHVLVYDFAARPNVPTAIAVRDGRPTGQRLTLHAMAAGLPRTHTDGSLLVVRGHQGGRVFLGTLDESGRAVEWAPLNLTANALREANFTWSPDSEWFGYMSREAPGMPLVSRIVDLSTRVDRELYRGPNLVSCMWGILNPHMYCTQAGGPTTMDVVAVDIASGRAERVGAVQGRAMLHHVTNDGRFLVGAVIPDFVEWEIGTTRQTRVPHVPSPDRRWYLAVRPGESGLVIRLRPREGTDSDWKDLVRRNNGIPPTQAVPISFSADGEWVFYHDRDSNGRDGFYRVSTRGGAPERLGDYPTTDIASTLSVSPNGRRFLANVAAPPTTPELVRVQNFLPVADVTAARPKGAESGR
jgi:Tol biopolymer transport system component